MEPNCLNCPSYTPAAQVVRVLKKSLDAPICATYGHVLGRPLEDHTEQTRLEVAIGAHKAKSCPSYGKDAPGFPSSLSMRVAMPNPIALAEANDRNPKDRIAPGTCSSCRFYVQPDKIAADHGWPVGACAVKGELLIPSRLVATASRCDVSHQADHRPRDWNFDLFPEFDEHFGDVNALDLKKMLEANLAVIEPTDHVTDKIVSDADKTAGIKGWRRITSPHDQKIFTYLPIFDPYFFSEDERAKIPKTGDDEHPELYIDHFGGVFACAVMWTELDETPTLWGEPGVGKTELFRHLAWLMSVPFERFSITAQTDLDELQGTKEYSPDRGTYFRRGRFVNAWAKPCVIVVDEPNTGPPEVWQFFRPLTDNSKQLFIDGDDGQRVTRSDDTYLGMAMNPAWDARNVGALAIGDADVRRLAHITVPLPPRDVEKKIISDRVTLDGWTIPSDALDRIMKIAGELRGLAEEGTLPISWGIAQQIKVARMLRWFDMVTAYKRAASDFLEPEAAEAMLAVVRAHIPSSGLTKTGYKMVSTMDPTATDMPF